MDSLKRLLELHPAEAAPQLLGCELVVDGVSSLITEVEAYGGVGEDPASHAFKRQTARNAVMFDRVGTLYVYFTYGMHWCANVVSHRPGEAGAILLRATRDVVGPARLCAAKGISGADNGTDLLDPASRVRLKGHQLVGTVLATPRTGISVARDLPWRFYLEGEPVSPHRVGRQRAGSKIRQDDGL